MQVDVAVIGAGPAGLAAASRAREVGAKRVVVIERAEEPGGLLHQCIHTGFGLQYFKEDLTGPEYAHRFLKKAEELGVEIILETMVLEISKDLTLKAVNAKRGLFHIQAKAIVLAMGCRERTRGPLLIPGTRPAGIFTSGTAQRFVNVEGFIPGESFFILGSGDVGMIMARRLTLEGAKVVGVAEILPYIGGLIRNEVQCLRDFNIPVYLRHTVLEIHGKDRVEGVTIGEVDEKGKPIAGTEKHFQCDTLLLSVGLIPENELSLGVGVELDRRTGGAVVDEFRGTSVKGIFAGGNVLHVHDLVDNVSIESEVAGESAALYAMGKLEMGEEIARLIPGQNIRYVVPQIIRGKRDAVIYARVTRPVESATLHIGDIYKKRFNIIRPSTMIAVKLERKEIERLKGEVKVWVEGSYV